MFKKSASLQQRINESSRIRAKFPDRIPVVCEPASGTSIVIDKSKYLVPENITVGQFIWVIRERMQMDERQALFLFVNGVLPPTGALMGQLYSNRADEDGFLYVEYSDEVTFGCDNSSTSSSSSGGSSSN